MEQIDKFRKMDLKELYDLKCIIDSIANSYAEKLTDYALISGDNTLKYIPEEKYELHQKRNEYNCTSTLIEKVLVEKIDKLLC